MTVEKIRVLLIDDHRLFLAGLHSLLDRQEDIAVVGEAADGRTGLQLSAELSPDVIMMDVTMPELNGVETTRQILAQLPATRVIALSAHCEPQLVAAMLKAGAVGYLPKSSDPQELTKAIRVVADGKHYLSPEVAGGVVDGCVRAQIGTRTSSHPSLSARECEVLQLLAEGKTTSEITMLLHVGRKTVETYRRRLMTKLDLHSLAELVKYAIREGLTGADR